MLAPFVVTVPAAGATALLTMSGSTEGALPECRGGAADHVAGGDASAKKLTIGYLLCNEDDRHHSLSSRKLGHAWSSWSADSEGAFLSRSVAELQHSARGTPPRTAAADPLPDAVRNGAGVGGSRADEHRTGHASSGAGRDVRLSGSSPQPPPRNVQRAEEEERTARLSIPPLRLLHHGGKQGGDPASTEGPFELPTLQAPQVGRFGGGRQEWSPTGRWGGPLVNRNDRPAPLPPTHLPNPSTGGCWNGFREKTIRHPTQTDQRTPPQETSPVRPERTIGSGAQGRALSTPHSEASDPTGHPQRRLSALWRPLPAAEKDTPSSGCARVSGPDLPRQRPYAPVDGRVARVASWQRSVGGVGLGTSLPYPPRRALRSPGRGLQSLFHGGLPPLLPPSSTSLSLADLQRSPPAAPLTRRFDGVDPGAAPADGGAEGGPTSAPDRGPQRQPCLPGGDTKDGVSDRERGSQSPQVQPVDAINGVSSNPVKAEAPPGAAGVIFPTDKPKLDPVRLERVSFISFCMLCLLQLPSEVGEVMQCIGYKLWEVSHGRCRWPFRAPATTPDWPSGNLGSPLWAPHAISLTSWLSNLVTCRSQLLHTRAMNAVSASLIAVSCSPTSATYMRGPGDHSSANVVVLASGNALTSKSTLQPCTSRRSRTPARSVCTALAAAVTCTYTVALAFSLGSSPSVCIECSTHRACFNRFLSPRIQILTFFSVRCSGSALFSAGH